MRYLAGEQGASLKPTADRGTALKLAATSGYLDVVPYSLLLPLTAAAAEGQRGPAEQRGRDPHRLLHREARGGPAAGVDAALAAGVADLGFGSTVVVAAARLSGIS